MLGHGAKEKIASERGNAIRLQNRENARGVLRTRLFESGANVEKFFTKLKKMADVPAANTEMHFKFFKRAMSRLHLNFGRDEEQQLMEYIDIDGSRSISVAELAFFLDPKGTDLADYFTPNIRQKLAQEAAEVQAQTIKEEQIKQIGRERNKEFIRNKGNNNMEYAKGQTGARKQTLRTPKLNLYNHAHKRPHTTSNTTRQSFNPLAPIANGVNDLDFAWTGMRMRQPKLPNFTRSRKKNGQWKNDFERYQHSSDLNMFSPVQQPFARMQTSGR
jgi:Ca2+-binding EF-hand superfamily protein